jgi:CBS domain-containing protein
MNKNQSPHSVTPQVIIDFLKNTIPFKELDIEALNKLSEHCIIDFFPKGAAIFKQGETIVNYLYLIQKGGVKLFMKDEDGNITLKDFRGEGSYIGALPIIQNTRANFNVETIEDTFCFLLEKKAFLELLNSDPKISQFYLRSFSDKLIKTAYSELRHSRITPKGESGFYLFTVKVGDIVKREPETINSTDSIRDAAVKMSEKGFGSLLIRDSRGEVVGIITDKDLRVKVVAKGLSYTEPVSTVMATPVKEISAYETCFNALLQMISTKIHHLAVEKDKKIVGVVTAHDIMVLQGSSPLYIFRETIKQTSIEGLYPLTSKIVGVVRYLIQEGAKAFNIARMITVLNDHILEKLLTLLIDELGAPPQKFCWILMGSEGRKEQTFYTDQDNAIIYEYKDKLAEEYFREFSKKAIGHLVKCGYPLCPGDIMASNPKWCQPFDVWKGYFNKWVCEPLADEIRNATIFFDLRPGYGSLELGRELREYITEITPDSRLFLYQLAIDALETGPPLTFFKNFIVEKDGEHRNHLDIKKRGIVPFVDFARLMSLACGIKETNTLDRLISLEQQGHISKDLLNETMDAYEFQMQLRLVHQLRLIEDGKQPDNYINPSDISDIEKRTLKDAFAVIGRLHGVIRNKFQIRD